MATPVNADTPVVTPPPPQPVAGTSGTRPTPPTPDPVNHEKGREISVCKL